MTSVKNESQTDDIFTVMKVGVKRGKTHINKSGILAHITNKCYGMYKEVIKETCFN